MASYSVCYKCPALLEPLQSTVRPPKDGTCHTHTASQNWDMPYKLLYGNGGRERASRQTDRSEVVRGCWLVIRVQEIPATADAPPEDKIGWMLAAAGTRESNRLSARWADASEPVN